MLKEINRHDIGLWNYVKGSIFLGLGNVLDILVLTIYVILLNKNK